MQHIDLGFEADFDGWRAAARRLVAGRVPPGNVVWTVADRQRDLFAPAPVPDRQAEPPAPAFTVPRAFVTLAADAICHSDRERFGLLYALLWRLHAGERSLLEIASDPLVARVSEMAKAVRRDQHKMKAFVRFREVADEDGGVRFLSWFEPEHFVVDSLAPFFADRFAAMRWAILTPYRSMAWDGEAVTFGPGGRRDAVPDADALDDQWRTYYASIFNPARLKPAHMRAEMPKKYWHNLPEARLIRPLIEAAGGRAGAMVDRGGTVPAKRTAQAVAARSALEVPAADVPLAAEAAGCRACPLWRDATGTVFGEGPATAGIMFVGEQPGDQEDLAGRPFVGPAGEVFDRALAEAGLDRLDVYVTNAVKHFKFRLRGKRRIHERPGRGEVQACGQWLAREIAQVRPRLIVGLGSTALFALLGRDLPVTRVRGRVLQRADGIPVLATVHPSYILRLPEEAARTAAYARFVEDLRPIAAGPVGREAASASA